MFGPGSAAREEQGAAGLVRVLQLSNGATAYLPADAPAAVSTPFGEGDVVSLAGAVRAVRLATNGATAYLPADAPVAVSTPFGEGDVVSLAGAVRAGAQPAPRQHREHVLPRAGPDRAEPPRLDGHVRAPEGRRGRVLRVGGRVRCRRVRDEFGPQRARVADEQRHAIVAVAVAVVAVAPRRRVIAVLRAVAERRQWRAPREGRR